MKWTLNRAFRLNTTFNVHGKIGAEMNCLPRSWVQWYSVCSMCAGPWFGPITSTVITIKWKIKKIKWLAGHLGRILALLSRKHPIESTAAWLCSESSLWLPLAGAGRGGTLLLLLHYKLLWLWKHSHGELKSDIWTYWRCQTTSF